MRTDIICPIAIFLPQGGSGMVQTGGFVLRLRVLLRFETQMWVAQCLEHDIAVQGRSIPEAKRMFLATLRAQVRLDVERGKKPLEGIPPAPHEYEREFEEAEALKDEPEISLTSGVPPAYQIAALSEEFRVSS
jgi:hypothetical protein